VPAPPPPRTVEQTTKTTTIRNHVNVKKNSLTLLPSPTDPNKLGVKFTFDANIECWVSVFFVGSENPQKGCEVLQIRANGSAPPPPAPPRSHHSQAGRHLSSSSGCAGGVQWVCSGCIGGVQGVFPGCLEDVQGMVRGW